MTHVGCLHKLKRSFEIKCPKCYHPTVVNAEGVSSLAKNFAILEIIYCIPDCRSPDSPQSKEANWTTAYPTNLDSKPSLPTCPEHGDLLSSFCVTDMKLVCSSCLVYGSHKKHPCKLLKDAALDCHRVLSSLTPDLAEQQKKMKDALSVVETELETVKSTSLKLSSQIDQQFDQLVNVLNARRKVLQLDVLERSQVRIEAMAHQLQWATPLY